MFRKVNKIHFVGIGGIGMSGIAELLLNQGFEVSGSDIVKSEITNNLKQKGATIHIGHQASNLKKAEALVFSSAVSRDNVDLIRASEKKIPINKRAEKMVDDDLTRLWDATDLCRSDDAIFAASGVCDGYLPGVIVNDDNVQTFAEFIDVQTGKVTRHDRTHSL